MYYVGCYFVNINKYISNEMPTKSDILDYELKKNKSDDYSEIFENLSDAQNWKSKQEFLEIIPVDENSYRVTGCVCNILKIIKIEP